MASFSCSIVSQVDDGCCLRATSPKRSSSRRNADPPSLDGANGRGCTRRLPAVLHRSARSTPSVGATRRPEDIIKPGGTNMRPVFIGFMAESFIVGSPFFDGRCKHRWKALTSMRVIVL